ncbi:hypothetical protein F5Y16DRAFT_116773 [Xylariaceae sp. FL0255]|nr:hypothetical protein F5Y16DRAFT_116773 [Xylariaceae sp. FL0255]
MSVDLSDLSDEHIARLTKVLARRPEHGVAMPSRRWLVRQEEKIKYLPKDCLRPSNPLKRLAIKIADSIDADILDPQAVLCKVHSSLNAFLIRRMFLALAYEVTVHTDAIRSWPTRTAEPELSAFVGRMDSISALWTSPQLFHQIYGTTPFDSRQIYVQTGCEACVLAAVGASGRILADLRAGLIDRVERRRRPADKTTPDRLPRMFRVVDSWIEHLRKKNEERDRAQECIDLSEDLLDHLRRCRPEIRHWRKEQRKIHVEKRASRQVIYSEMKKTNSGAKIIPLTSNSYKRRTRHGIPVALADVEGADYQKQAAEYANDATASIYRPDSLCDSSLVDQRQTILRDLPTGPRPGAPEPRLSGPSNGSPTRSFIQRFENEVSIDPYDDAETDIIDERDYEREEESREKVANWYEHRLAETQLDVRDVNDHETVISMVHPAFRAELPPSNKYAPSAVPAPLHIKRDRTPAPGEDNGQSGNARSSEWTDATVYTVDPTEYSSPPSLTHKAPPIPRMPTAFREEQQRQQGKARESPSVGSTSITIGLRHGSPTPTSGTRAGTPIRPPSPKPSIASSKYSDTALNWPAPPQGSSPASPSVPSVPRSTPAPYQASSPPPAPHNTPATPPQTPGKKINPKRYLFMTDSEVGSRLSTHQRAYVRDRKQGLKEYPAEMNPFASPRTRTPLAQQMMNQRTPTPGQQQQGQYQYQYQQPRVEDDTSALTGSRAASAVPSLGTSHGNTIISDSSDEYTDDETETHWEGGEQQHQPGIWGNETVLPDESASNVQWNGAAGGRRASSVTRLGHFQGQM